MKFSACGLLLGSMLIFYLFYISFYATGANTVKIVIINDIHYERFYSPYSSREDCRRNNNLTLEELEGVPYAYLGRYGCDSPPCLIEAVFSKINRDNKPDVLLMAGDYTSHDVASKSQDDSVIAYHYSVLKEIYQHLFDGYVRSYFGYETDVLPAFGNNDYKVHYGYPTTTETQQDFY